ncbi:isoamylase early set domain-containing protein [Pontibacter sp. 172403-2]|uniref:isoamylase early set domain-containing protein n=1 Tax=Pontibacter rufus TaxID=2791028 RepID=UPI0018AFC13B|nr:isoamylase early set domain-containing protein [Pontibacter sp. 172403-2]MBF9255108.1 isoamylase early set domain-containing protein [Pontibacter sp. 172403-2]
MIKKTYFKTKDHCKVRFTVDHENAETVEILGLHNDWNNPTPMSRKKGGSFTYETSLPKNSQHEFRYLVNKTEWMNDPEADSQKPNEFGSNNSILSL